MTDPLADTAPATPTQGTHRPGSRKPRAPGNRQKPRTAPTPRNHHPVLEQLATLYPGLFGQVFLPLKRGIFQDLLAAHPDVLARDTLKAALALHTRSTRYLVSVAKGLPRHDLQGLVVEEMAPGHVHLALLEVYRRRQSRTSEDLRPELCARISQVFESSGLSKEAYDALVRSKDEAANAVLDEALAEASARQAKDEALRRAFEQSGLNVTDFAGMYGLAPDAVDQSLQRARRRQAELTAPAEGAP